MINYLNFELPMPTFAHNLLTSFPGPFKVNMVICLNWHSTCYFYVDFVIELVSLGVHGGWLMRSSVVCT
jgi:hypothetical protein